MKIISKDRQCLLDLALIATGSVEGAVDIAVANGISLTSELDAGTELSIPGRVLDARVVEKYGNENVLPATEISAAERAACPYGGIGYMGIEVDFKVS